VGPGTDMKGGQTIPFSFHQVRPVHHFSSN
jgi:hypothetical protein